MLRIAILTFSRACNYGAVYQAYSLKSYLEKMGHKVYILDYRQKNIENSYSSFSIANILKKPKYLLSTIAYFYFRKNRNMQFKRFRKQYLNLSNPIYEINDINEYDLYIHGSDQLWNPKLVGYDKIFWGFYNSYNGMKCTYAMSFESDSIDKLSGDQVKLGLENFDFISLREEYLIPKIRPYTNKFIYHTIDPTLLAGKDIWEKFIHKNETKDPYILFYQVGISKQTQDILNYLSKKLHLEVKIVSGPIMKYNLYKTNPSPEEFINLLYHAKYIVSTSFHATTFALLFHKEFYTIKVNSGSDVRYYSLLDSLGLSSRIISNKENINIDKKINYSEVDKELKKIRQGSINYLNTITDAACKKNIERN